MSRLMYVFAFCWWLVCGCGDGTTEADRIGVGAECSAAVDCPAERVLQLECLDFKGGYCGLQGCANDAGCPEGSACVAHVDAKNYCFRVCEDKPECNYNRTDENASNCSANVVFVGGAKESKACVPPSASL